MRQPRHPGFTLLEVVVALAILALALMAIFDLNSGAVAMHAYAKRLTVASMLARSKMTDIEQELYDKGFSENDEEREGDFSKEGWDSFKWRATILAPKTQNLTPEQMVSAMFNIDLSSTDIGPLKDLFLGGQSSDDKKRTNPGSPAPSLPSPSTSAPTPTPAGAGLGPLAGMIQGQFTQMLDQLSKAVREIHLTVSWREGRKVETLDLVTHVVSLGAGSDRNGDLRAAAMESVNRATLGMPGGLGVPNQPPNQPPKQQQPQRP